MHQVPGGPAAFRFFVENPDLLTENKAVWHDSGKGRRWFSDDYFDLIFWYDSLGTVTGFQLCYEKETNEHAFTWHREKGVSHHGIDTGEEVPTRNSSPVLVPDGNVPYETIVGEFKARAVGLEASLHSLVLGTLQGTSPER